VKGLLQRLRDWLGAGAAGAELLSPAAVAELIAAIRSANLTYCGPPKLEHVAEAALRVRAERVPGRFVEAGVALGGSAILIGALKPPNAPLDLYDAFATIPPPGPGDGEDAHRRYAEIAAGASKGLGGDVYYGYLGDLLARVQHNLRAFGLDPARDAIRCVPGLFADTLRPDGPVAFAHVDCDWYDSVRVCIERLEPVLSPGAIIVFDDYESYSGCRRAVDEWLSQAEGFETIFRQRSLGVRRTGPR
jgi:hypothetical protein